MNVGRREREREEGEGLRVHDITDFVLMTDSDAALVLDIKRVLVNAKGQSR